MYPTPRVPVALAGLVAALCASPVLAADPVPGPDVAAQLSAIEATAPKEWKDPVAIAASHAQVIALIDANALKTASDYRRAATLFNFHLMDPHVIRIQYELMLTATALDVESTHAELAIFWDQLMNRLGRPVRFDFGGGFRAMPQYSEFEAAPACI